MGADYKDDWRYQGQEKYLRELKFSYSEYITISENDHDHCEFCANKFSNTISDALKEGWTDDTKYRWICDDCFQDFEHEIGLKKK
jgi:chromosomal replication initiation ATPase DnaA